MVKVTPIDGWGYQETVDGKLAPAFGVEVAMSGVDVGGGIRGWRGRIGDGKYQNAVFIMTPRSDPWIGTVVIQIFRTEDFGPHTLLFAGMADTTGLECTWQ